MSGLPARPLFCSPPASSRAQRAEQERAAHARGQQSSAEPRHRDAPEPPEELRGAREPRGPDPAGTGQDPAGAWCGMRRAAEAGTLLYQPQQLRARRCSRADLARDAQEPGEAAQHLKPGVLPAVLCRTPGALPFFIIPSLQARFLNAKLTALETALRDAAGTCVPRALWRAGGSPGSPRGFAPLGEMRSVSIHAVPAALPEASQHLSIQQGKSSGGTGSRGGPWEHPPATASPGACVLAGSERVIAFKNALARSKV